MRRGLIIGRGRGVWDEVREAQALCEFDDIIVVNKAALDWPDRIDHWVSFHADLMMDRWLVERRQRGYPDPANYWTSIFKGKPLSPKFDVQRVRCDGGSSGLVAVVVAIEGAGDDRIVLAGIPMEASAGHYDEEGEWSEALKYRGAWEDRLDLIGDRVRSMSGWTRDLLGAPTQEWLAG